MTKEIWKDIKGYEGYYQVSSLGRIKTTYKNKKEKIKSLRASSNKYFNITLWKNYKQKTYSVHRLVADYFIENNENKKYVNHKNSNRQDNRVTNLEWCNKEDNCRYRKKINKKTSSKYKGVYFYKSKRKKPWSATICFNYKKNSLGYFYTEKEAAVAYNDAAKKYFKEFALLNEF